MSQDEKTPSVGLGGLGWLGGLGGLIACWLACMHACVVQGCLVAWSLGRLVAGLLACVAAGWLGRLVGRCVAWPWHWLLAGGGTGIAPKQLRELR